VGTAAAGAARRTGAAVRPRQSWSRPAASGQAAKPPAGGERSLLRDRVGLRIRRSRLRRRPRRHWRRPRTRGSAPAAGHGGRPGSGADEPLSTTSSSNRGSRATPPQLRQQLLVVQWTTTPVNRGSGGRAHAWRLLLLCQIPEAADFAQRHGGRTGPGKAGEETHGPRPSQEDAGRQFPVSPAQSADRSIPSRTASTGTRGQNTVRGGGRPPASGCRKADAKRSRQGLAVDEPACLTRAAGTRSARQPAARSRPADQRPRTRRRGGDRRHPLSGLSDGRPRPWPRPKISRAPRDRGAGSPCPSWTACHQPFQARPQPSAVSGVAYRRFTPWAAAARVGLQDGDQRSQPARLHHGVVVHRGHPLSRCRGDPHVVPPAKRGCARTEHLVGEPRRRAIGVSPDPPPRSRDRFRHPPAGSQTGTSRGDGRE